MQLKLNKLPWYGQVGAFVALSAAAIGAFWYFYETPTRAEMAIRQRQLESLRVEIAKVQVVARKLPEFRAQIAELEARLDNLRAVLPEQKDVGDLLRRIQTLATQSNLEIRGFKPQAISQKQMHAEWPIALDLEGNYHDLAMFFDKVSKVPRIINVSQISIKSRDSVRGARAQSALTSTVMAECLATTFVLSEAPAGAADAKKVKPGAKAGAAAPNAAARPAPAAKPATTTKASF
jgi:type IV pilus assembly protein PilO